MDSKKEKLITILSEIKNDWPIASGILLLISRTNTSAYQIEFLLDLFENLLNETKINIDKNKLLRGISKLKSLKIEEENEYKNEQKELDLIFNKL